MVWMNDTIGCDDDDDDIIGEGSKDGKVLLTNDSEDDECLVTEADVAEENQGKGHG